MTCEYILSMKCPDRPGILAKTTQAINDRGGDVRDAVSFGDDATATFFIRIHLTLPNVDEARAFEADVESISKVLGVAWTLHDCNVKPRVLIAVSMFDHCLLDLLYRWKSGSLDVDIPVVVSNHETNRGIVERHGIPYIHLPVSKETKQSQEQAIVQLVDEHHIDLTVLARYMQILSPWLCEQLAGRCINIHHSFLPSFKGAAPYKQAHDRGVKIIGATAHYVTTDLDEGPIIEQDVRRVTHATSASEMESIGREIESSVLSRAVRAHVEHRLQLNGSKTVVFA